MANRGVYSREDNSPEAVGRSIQTWNQQKSIDARFMEIYPTYHDVLYPHETIRIRPSMFVRTIPMVAPVLSRIRIVTRFYAVPIRVLWQPWEKYIDISNDDYDFTLEEPYLINCTGGARLEYTYSQDGQLKKGRHITSGNNGKVTANCRVSFSGTDIAGNMVGYNRGFTLLNGFVANDYVKYPANFAASGHPQRGGLFVFPHDLMDYFDAPIGVDISPYKESAGAALGVNSVRFNAYKAAAYQLCYSFGYRLPNVQKRVDDYYQMAKSDDYEFSPYLYFSNSGLTVSRVWSVPQFTAEYGSQWTNGIDFRKCCIVNYKDTLEEQGYEDMSSSLYTDDKAQSSDAEAVLRTSWDKTELFPLKAGANASLQAWRLNNYGSLEFVPSNISLTRKRFANWQMDYFTSCNPWQQRGTEAQIPLSGSLTVTLPNSTTIDISDFTVTVPPHHPAADTITASSDIFIEGSAQSLQAAFDAQGSGYLVGPESKSGLMYSDASFDASQITIPSVTASSVGEATVSLSDVRANVQNGLFVSPSNFRFAMALQKIKEMSARTDGRYKHYLSKFFGSFVHDDRIDYPEFLGGVVQDLNVDVVTQTSESGDTDLGTLAGNGVSAKTGYTITYHAKEHTIILALTHIVPEARYNGGLDRQDNCSDPYDWMLPQFSGLSEQPVYNYELACRDSYDTAESNRVVFGYEPYLNYLRGKSNRANGAFRDSFNFTGSYNYFKPWIIQRDFGKKLVTGGDGVGLQQNVPTLSDEFLSGRGTTDNSMFTVADDRLLYPFIIDSAFQVRATRNIPSRGIPRV